MRQNGTDVSWGVAFCQFLCRRCASVASAGSHASRHSAPTGTLISLAGRWAARASSVSTARWSDHSTQNQTKSHTASRRGGSSRVGPKQLCTKDHSIVQANPARVRGELRTGHRGATRSRLVQASGKPKRRTDGLDCNGRGLTSSMAGPHIKSSIPRTIKEAL